MFGFGHGFALSGFAALVGLLTMFLFWVAVIVLAIWIVRALTSPSHDRVSSRHPQDDSAMRILRERYARGEIDSAEFEQARRVLEGRDRTAV